jgi:signal transduction histidine kinase
LPEKLLAYRAILEDLGSNVVTCRSGAEALKHLLRQEFAVILLDVQMPEMNGLEIAEMIRRRKKTAFTPIIFLTAFTDEVRIADGYAHGAVDFMQTPVVPGILRAKVKVFVDLYQMNRQVRLQAEERITLTEERAKRATVEEANRRLAYLAEASRILAGSLDTRAIARAVARLAVPTLADIGELTLSLEPGLARQRKIVWIGESDSAVHSRWMAEKDDPADVLHDVIDGCLTSGHPVHLDDLDLVFVPDPELPARAGGHIRALAVFPMLARGRTIGSLALAFGNRVRGRDPADLATAADLASRAAVAFDNARLYHEIQQADRKKNEFLATLAHELRNPLAPIRNGLSILRMSGELSGQAEKTRDMMERQVSHMVRLIDDLLDVARITRGKMELKRERTDFRQALEAAVESSRPLIEAARHAFVQEIEPGPYPIFGDVTRLAQVFTNLINNAAKYTPEGGHIRVEVERAVGILEARIRDDGVGISPEGIADVFDLFNQAGASLDRSQGGLGIGLTLARRIVEMHGGTVAVESPGVGKGSTFTVRLPLANGEQ